MKNFKSLVLLLILTVFLASSTCFVMAEARNIYIGDLIELKITSKDITTEELRDKFKDFEIVDIKEDSDNYIIKVRCFEAGEKKVQIGNKELKINIKSTLKELKRTEIYDKNPLPEKPDSKMEWKYILIVSLIVFLVTGIRSLLMLLGRIKKASFGPYQVFVNQSKALSIDSTDYLVNLTKNFKQYIEAKYSCRIRGKTSSEIMSSLSDIPALESFLQETKQWLVSCDYFKFAGVSASNEKKQFMFESLLDLVKKIEDTKEVKT